MPTFVSHLESAIDGTRFPAGQLSTMHKGRPLWVRYDLQAAAHAISPEILQDRPADLWRYRELLPVVADKHIVSLGETMTPLLRCPRLGASLGLAHLWIKDESRLPTGSFKSRGMAVAISMAHELGVERVAVATNGNAGGAMAAYAARAGMEAFVFMPADTPPVNVYESRVAGAKTFLVNGLIGDCGKLVRQGIESLGWFDMCTLKEPYRIEGKKTMGLELAEQFHWRLPDVILYPTGGGTGLIGMWKAFAELVEMGWLPGEQLPKMIAVQSTGCSPIVKAYTEGAMHAEPFADAATVAAGIRVPSAIGDFMILDAVRASGGCAVAVDEASILGWMRMAASAEGISICPEAAACVGALEQLTREGVIGLDQRAVIFNTAGVQKYTEAMQVEIPRIDKDQPIDWDRIAAGE